MNIKSQNQRTCAKYLPKSMVKYLNMQTSLCPVCLKNDRKARSSIDHLKKTHGVSIQENKLLIEEICKIEESKYTNNPETKGNKRKSILEAAESLIMCNINKFQNFLNATC